MLSGAIFTVLALSAASVRAQVVQCEALEQPDWDACDKIYSDMIANEGTTPGFEFSLDNCQNQCLVYFDPNEVTNCAISHCWSDQVEDCSKGFTFQEFGTFYAYINSNCEPQQAGGRSPVGQAYQVLALRNPEFSGRVDPETLRKNSKIVNGLRVAQYSIDELWPYTNASESKSTSTSTRRSRSSLTKRADPASWTTVTQSFDVTKPNTEYQVSDILSGGVEQTWEVSEGMSVSITTSFSAGIEFEIFSASIGIEVTNEYSKTITQGQTYTVGECPSNQGVVFWLPLFDHYVGWFDGNSNDIKETWIPVTKTNGDAGGRFETRCLG